MSKNPPSRRRNQASYRVRRRQADPEFRARERQRSNRAKAKRSKAGMRPWLGIDGESIDDRLVMVGASDETGEFQSVVEAAPGEELTTHEVFWWLVNLDPQGRYLKSGFWFDYDVNMIISGFTEAHLRRLAGDPGWVRWGEYLVRHIPGKELYVKHRPTGLSITIHDLAPFHRTSFVRLLRGWQIGDPDTWDRIEGMKGERAVFAEEQRDQIRAYMLEECMLLAQAYRVTVQAARDADIPLVTYYGGGSLASSLMRRQGVMDHHRDRGDAERFERMFYGGRFENAIVGQYPQQVWVYDINSAYPTVLRDLPCLAHGRWAERLPASGETAMIRTAWDVDSRFGPFPVRPRVGSLVYPSQGEGSYWSPEVLAAAHHLEGIDIQHSLTWEMDCEHRPFSWIDTLAAHRLELKRTGGFAAQMLKLGLNSIYGKLAQQVGTAPFHAPIWKGVVTSGVRAMLIEGWGPDPNRVLSMSTDSLVATQPLLHLPLGSALGEWTLEIWEWIFIAQGGVYFWPGEGQVVNKSRGFTGRGLQYSNVRAAWESGRLQGMVSVPQHRFVGYRTGLIRKDPVWRTWLDEERHMAFDPAPRRVAILPDDPRLSYAVTRPPNWVEQVAGEIDDLAWYAEDPTWWDEAKLADMEHLEQPNPFYDS